jgi:hypothetical protein
VRVCASSSDLVFFVMSQFEYLCSFEQGFSISFRNEEAHVQCSMPGKD